MNYIPYYDLLGTTESGKVITVSVPLNRAVASQMERISCANPYKYDKFHLLDLYYDALAATPEDQRPKVAS